MERYSLGAHGVAVVLLGTAGAQATQFVVDPSLSSIEATLDASGLTDSDSSPLSGTLELMINSEGDTPTDLTLEDYTVSADEPLDFVLGNILVGELDIDVRDLVVALPDGAGPVGPVPVGPGGGGSLADVPAVVSGDFSYSASGLLCSTLQDQGFPCSDTGPVSDGSTQTIPSVAFTVSEAGDQTRFDASFSLSQPLDPTQPGLGSVDFDVTLVAFGDAAPPCPGDTDANDVVDLSDLLTVLSNFGMVVGGGPADGDLDRSGVVDLEDLLEVLANFGLACTV
jgi:hypothetical protein